jgi:hypothetical protein
MSYGLIWPKIGTTPDLSVFFFWWRGVWCSSHIEFWDYTNIYMTNFIGSFGESEERTEKDVEHVGKNQWNGRVYKTRKHEQWKRNIGRCIALSSVDCFVW